MNDLTEDPLPVKLLPHSIQQLLDVLSINSVIVLIQVYGGSRLIVPKTADPNHELALLIGYDELKRFCEAYKSLVISLPRCLKAINFVRDNAILKDKRAGLTIAELARQYRLTERNICHCLRRAEQAEYHQHSNHYQPQTDWLSMLG